jgi:mRNA interferase MazF
MGSFTVGSVVLVRFPFSDLTGVKLRPAVIIAYSDNEDWILCQITSNPYADGNAVQIDDSSFEDGALQKTSYIRPGKLFTGNTRIIERRVGVIKAAVISELIARVVTLIRGDSKK